MLSLTTLHEFNFRWPTMVPGEVLALTLLMVFTVLATLEFHAPKEKLPKKHSRQSYKTNFGLSNSRCRQCRLILIGTGRALSDKGLLNSLSQPAWKTVLSFLMLDLLCVVAHEAKSRLRFYINVPQGAS